MSFYSNQNINYKLSDLLIETGLIPIVHLQATLKERYNKLDLTYENFLGTLLEVADIVSKEKLTLEGIILILNIKFEKILFFKKANEKFKNQADTFAIHRLGILGAELDIEKEIPVIYISDVFLKTLQNEHTDFEILTQTLYSIWTHEISHLNQITAQKAKNNKIVQGIAGAEDINNINWKKYLADPKEIAARAREIIAILLSKYSINETSDIINKIHPNYEDILLNIDPYKVYAMYFGDIKGNDIKIWNTLYKNLKRFINIDGI